MDHNDPDNISSVIDELHNSEMSNMFTLIIQAKRYLIRLNARTDQLIDGTPMISYQNANNEAEYWIASELLRDGYVIGAEPDFNMRQLCRIAERVELSLEIAFGFLENRLPPTDVGLIFMRGLIDNLGTYRNRNGPCNRFRRPVFGGAKSLRKKNKKSKKSRKYRKK